MGDERIRRPGDAWQRAIGNVIVALVFPFSLYWSSTATVRRRVADGADPVVDRRWHCPVHLLEGRRNGLSPPSCCLCRAADAKPAQPCKELVSCLSPRVV